jgi:Protein of unknown function (DUF2809)
MPYRVSLLLSILVIIPLGYFVRFSSNTYWSSTFGAIAYQMLWITLVQLIVPKASPKWTAIGVFIFACAIEFLQLWQSPWLQAIRATLPGRLLLGNTFLWDDFPPYFLGCFLGWIAIKLLRAWRLK